MICAVLGRGKSLINYKDIQCHFDAIYIINNFNKEIKEIGIDYFLNKNIIHVVGRGPNQLSEKLYKKLRIREVICNSFESKDFKNAYPVDVKFLPQKMKTRGYPSVGMENIQHYMEECDCYKDIIKKLKRKIRNGKLEIRHKNRRAWPTTSLLAIDLCLMENSPEKLYLFGIDFYKNDYLTKANKEYQNEDWYKSKAMIKHLEYLVIDFPNTQFYSSHELDWEFDNWNNV